MEQKGKGLDNPNSMVKQRNQLQDPIAKSLQQQPQPLPQKCPRCESIDTKFCYYNNYSFSQPRYFCKTCRRYWTHGGTLRNIPVGGGGCRRRGKRPKIASSLSSPPQTPSFRTQQFQLHHMASSSNASDPILIVKEDGDNLLKSYCDTSSSGYFFSSSSTSIHHQPMDCMSRLAMAPTSIQTLSPNGDFDLAEAESLIQGLLQDDFKISLNPSLYINDNHQQQQQLYQNETTNKAVGDSLMFESCKFANSNISHNDQEQTSWTQSFINSMTIKNASASVSNGNSDTNMNNSTTVRLSSSNTDQLSGNYNLPGYSPP